jgi:6-phosphofructokinase
VGFANIVIAEGAKPKAGSRSHLLRVTKGSEHVRPGAVFAYQTFPNNLKMQAAQPKSVKTVFLGHVQRGGTPIAF